MCPYDSPKFYQSASIVQKCTFCNHRLHEGLEPACVAWCPTGALGLGERNGAPGVAGVDDDGDGTTDDIGETRTSGSDDSDDGSDDGDSDDVAGWKGKGDGLSRSGQGGTLPPTDIGLVFKMWWNLMIWIR